MCWDNLSGPGALYYILQVLKLKLSIEVNNMLPENNWWASQMVRRHHVHFWLTLSSSTPKEKSVLLDFFTSLGLLLGGLGNTELHCLTQRGDDLSESSTVKSWIFFDILLFIFKFLNNSINFLQFRPVIWAVQFRLRFKNL